MGPFIRVVDSILLTKFRFRFISHAVWSTHCPICSISRAIIWATMLNDFHFTSCMYKHKQPTLNGMQGQHVSPTSTSFSFQQ